MTPKRPSGLGKGLDNLIPNKRETRAPEPVKEQVVKEASEKEGLLLVDINDIETNPAQPRKSFDEDKLIELSESIKQFGVISPILVNKKNGYYEIVAGERRWRAAKMAGLKELPVIVQNYSEQEMMEVAIIENIQRENLNPIEEAMAFRKLLIEFDLRQDEVAERVSKSRAAVTNSMRLLKLDSKIQQMIIDEKISTGHARALLALEDEDEQYILANRIFDERLSVREIEKIIKQLKSPKPIKKVQKEEPVNVYKNIEEILVNVIGTKVKVIEKGNGKGKIEIEYYSEEDLERIYDLMLTVELQ